MPPPPHAHSQPSQARGTPHIVHQGGPRAQQPSVEASFPAAASLSSSSSLSAADGLADGLAGMLRAAPRFGGGGGDGDSTDQHSDDGGSDGNACSRSVGDGDAWIPAPPAVPQAMPPAMPLVRAEPAAAAVASVAAAAAAAVGCKGCLVFVPAECSGHDTGAGHQESIQRLKVTKFPVAASFATGPPPKLHRSVLIPHVATTSLTTTVVRCAVSQVLVDSEAGVLRRPEFRSLLTWVPFFGGVVGAAPQLCTPCADHASASAVNASPPPPLVSVSCHSGHHAMVLNSFIGVLMEITI